MIPPDGYDHIQMNYTQLNIPILPELPADYRWADEVEVEYWWHIPGAIQVDCGNDENGMPYTDLAVPLDPDSIDLQAYNS